MIVLTDYRFKSSNKTTYCRYDGTQFYEFSPDYFMDEVTDIIENSKESYIYITNGDNFGLRLIYSLCAVGYHILQGQVKDKSMHERDFTYLISGNNDFYNIKLKRRKRILRIYNADKLLTLNDRNEIIDTWGSHKMEYFYSPKNYAFAVHRALTEINSGFKRLMPCTISSASRKKFNSMFNFFVLRNWVQDMRSYELDEFLRPAYRGGICFLNYDLINKANKTNERKTYKNGVIVDKNSMYPWVMKTKPIPYGEPHEFSGKPTEDMLNQQEKGLIYIFVKIKVSFDIKKGKIPCISITGEQVADREPGWARSSKRYSRRTGKYLKGNDKVELVLTYTDFKLLQECYDINYLSYIGGVYFSATKKLFYRYINYWYERKRNASSVGEQRVCKMMLNTLSGNLAKRIDAENLLIDYNKELDQIEIDTNREFGVIPSTIHIGAAITSYAREEIVKLGNKYYDRLLYIDTDSLHLLGQDTTGIKIGKELGQYKIEHKFEEAAYYKPKMYGFKEFGKVHFKFAGVPKQTTGFIEGVINDDFKMNDKINYDIILPEIFGDDFDNIRYKTILAFSHNKMRFDLNKYIDPLKGIVAFDSEGKLVKLGAYNGDYDEYTKIGRSIIDFLLSVSNMRRRNSALIDIVFCKIPVWHFIETDDGFQEKMEISFRDLMNINKFVF